MNKKEKNIQKISINLQKEKQKIWIGNKNKILQNIEKSKIGKDVDKFYIVCDGHILKNYGKLIKQIEFSLPTKSIIIEYKSQGSAKKLTEVCKYIEKINELGASRNSCIIVVGGGMMGDLWGLIASLYMRGIKRIFVPTTLMSMADSTIGKIAVNVGNKKNIAGIFGSPNLTICITNFIESMPEKLVYEGLVEILKHAIITRNKEILEITKKIIIEKNNIDWQKLIYESLKIKKGCVEKDPRDRKGSHKLLSFGHTLSNFLETESGISHGSGVLVGMIFEITLSSELHLIRNRDKEDLLNICKGLSKKLKINGSDLNKILKIEKLIPSIKGDKINSSGSMYFLLPTVKGIKKINIKEEETIGIAVLKTIDFIKNKND